jgi:RNA polymerase sigma-70 factor (ECF subfamily)
MRLFRPTYHKATDEELMSMLIKSDQRAFDEIYQRYAGPLLHYFMRMLWRDREKAEDLVHDLFAKIIRKPDYFDPEKSFKTWVYSVACNMCKNEYKKKEVRKGFSNGLDLHYALADKSTNVLSDVEDAFFKEALNDQLNNLDDKHREAFTLRHVEGLSVKEIAEVLGINEGTVKSRVFYAIKSLAANLKEFKPVEK